MSEYKNNVSDEDFEEMIDRVENIKLNECEKGKLKNILIRGTEWRKSRKFCEIEYLKDKTQEELWEDLYILRYILEYPMSYIARYFNVSRIQVYRKMKDVEWTYNKAESMKIASKFKDFEKIMLKNRKSMLKKRAVGLGSNFEDYARQYINISLTELIKVYDVIIGINNLNIIRGKEIDIPIIIMDDIKTYKFVVEIGTLRDHKHRISSDLEKAICLEDKGYICFMLNEFTTNNKNEVNKELDKVIEKICDFIKMN